MNDKVSCKNCGTDFGNDVGAVGDMCPACKAGAIGYTEDQ